MGKYSFEGFYNYVHKKNTKKEFSTIMPKKFNMLKWVKEQLKLISFVLR